MSRAIHLWLTLSCGAILLFIALAWSSEDMHWSPPPPLPPELATLALPDANSASPPLAVAHERPLFSTDRRPPAAALAQAALPLPGPSPAPPDLFARIKLQGVVGWGEHGIVLITVDGRPQRLQVGQSIDAWRLARIDGLEIHFEHPDGQTRRMRIQRLGAKQATNQAAPMSTATQPPASPSVSADTQTTTPQRPVPSTSASSNDTAPSLAERVAERQAQRAAAEAAYRQWQSDTATASQTTGTNAPTPTSQ